MSCNAFGYADDIALLSPTKQGLNNLIRICEEYSKDYSIKFNSAKSQIVIFSNNTNNNTADLGIKINGESINTYNEVKHLGYTINNSNSFCNIKDIINDIKVRTNVINSNFKYLETNSKVKIFLSQCQSLYGCNLWNLSNPDVNLLEIAWRKCCRSILSLPPRTHNVLLPPLMYAPDVRSIIEQRFLSFLIICLSHENVLISNMFN